MKQLLLSTLLIVFFLPAFCQDDEGGQSRESMAVDATAAQWSFQFAYEGFWNYRTDEISPGVQRPPGRKGFGQFRLVAPIPKNEKMPLTLLPRLTLRAVQNAQGEYGFGSSDIFVLGILNEWATGRWGIGPQINFPAAKPSDPSVPGSAFGNTNWGFGFAAAVTQRAANDKLFLAFLVQQAWSKNAAGETKATALALNPIIVYQLGNGFYIGNGDYVLSYNWQSKGWLIPIGVRLGKAFIGEKSTWNTYVEYQRSVAWPDWPGPVAGDAIRINVQFQLPVGI